MAAAVVPVLAALVRARVLAGEGNLGGSMPDKQPKIDQVDLPSLRLIREQSKWLAPARSWLLKQADLASRHSVLDLGCGFGIVTQELAAQAKGRVVALDHNYAALRTAPAAL